IRGPLGRRVAGGADGAVVVIIVALAVVADVDGAHDNPLRLVVFHRVFPPVHPFLPVGRRVAETGFEVAHLLGNVGDLHFLLRRVGDQRRLVVVVQKREQTVIFILFERVVLVIVALRALDRKAEDTFADA